VLRQVARREQCLLAGKVGFLAAQFGEHGRVHDLRRRDGPGRPLQHAHPLVKRCLLGKVSPRIHELQADCRSLLVDQRACATKLDNPVLGLVALHLGLIGLCLPGKLAHAP